MRINEINIKRYDAKQLTVEVIPPKIEVKTEWLEKKILPQELGMNLGIGNIKVTLLLGGESRSEIIRNASELLLNFSNATILDLDGYKGKYKGYLKNNSLMKTISPKRYKLELELEGYLIDEMIEIDASNKSTVEFVANGTRKAPCIIEIIPQKDIGKLSIGGFEEMISISNLTSGKIILIDSEKGIVLEEGVNKFAEIDMWEFPYIDIRRTNMVTFSDVTCNVKIKYSPMWI